MGEVDVSFFKDQNFHMKNMGNVICEENEWEEACSAFKLLEKGFLQHG